MVVETWNNHSIPGNIKSGVALNSIPFSYNSLHVRVVGSGAARL